MTTAQIEIPEKLIPVFATPGMRYRGAYGGRGSGKTRTFALMSAIYAYQRAEADDSGIILCGREFMNSLDESSMEEVKQAIRSVDWLNDYFDIGEKFIRTKNGRVKYAFIGLRHNLDSIKSKAKILLTWVDEAEGVSDAAYRKLRPTVREEGSEIWLTWNPELDGSPTDKFARKNPPDNAIFVEMNYMDNEFFPDVLEQERKDDERRLDPSTYAHVWEGAYLENSDAQVLSGKVSVQEFEPKDDWNGPYQGLDFGFAQDPTAGVRCWEHKDVLYVEYEAGKIGLEINETSQFLTAKIPDYHKYVTRGDSARPEVISYLKKNGMERVTAVEKWSGSVEDGIAHLRGYEKIIIHPRCRETIRETRLYSYKVDRLTGDILPKIVDAHNHYIDAIRYAIAPMIKSGRQVGMLLKKRHR